MPCDRFYIRVRNWLYAIIGLAILAAAALVSVWAGIGVLWGPTAFTGAFGVFLIALCAGGMWASARNLEFALEDLCTCIRLNGTERCIDGCNDFERWFPRLRAAISALAAVGAIGAVIYFGWPPSRPYIASALTMGLFTVFGTFGFLLGALWLIRRCIG